MEELHCRKERKVNDYSVWGSFVVKFGVLRIKEFRNQIFRNYRGKTPPGRKKKSLPLFCY